ncbi:MAG: NAD(P)H-dependent flavin oxidoreductase [Granulosicoccus sp.]
MWPNKKLIELTGLEHPIIQAPMAGASGTAMAIAVSEQGALGSLPCAMLDTTTLDAQITAFRKSCSKPVNLNFFCHKAQTSDAGINAKWKQQLTQYYDELELDSSLDTPAASRKPFDEAMCCIVEEQKPDVVSFHFGLPDQQLLERVKRSGSVVISSATTVEEAIWLEASGCDAIIAQGYEAGGHRGMFLADNIQTQAGIMALLPQVVDAVNIPVIAAGAITDGRGIVAALALGAAGVQIGSAYLLTPESLISSLHRKALLDARDDNTALTNLFSGKPARGLVNRLMQELGPMSPYTPVFPTAGAALAPLKSVAEKTGSADFSSLWAGQSAALARQMSASELTRTLIRETRLCLDSINTRL